MNQNRRIDRSYDPELDGQAVRTCSFQIDSDPFEPPRTNRFSIYHVESGAGVFWADSARFAFGPGSLLFFVPYQHIRIEPEETVAGNLVQFHANFLCVETFHAEVGCSGLLFNDPKGVPVVALSEPVTTEIRQAIERLMREESEKKLAYLELMLADLKTLLILATRLKTANPEPVSTKAGNPMHPVVLEFRELIETHFRKVHSPSEYAEMLHITPKTLGNIVKANLGTTASELVRSRILTYSKWQLLHTLKPVKQIAREVGFADELYFSRLFKKATGCSPTFFRDFETEIRGGSNLSMITSDVSIPDPGESIENDSTLNE